MELDALCINQVLKTALDLDEPEVAARYQAKADALGDPYTGKQFNKQGPMIQCVAGRPAGERARASLTARAQDQAVCGAGPLPGGD